MSGRFCEDIIEEEEDEVERSLSQNNKKNARRNSQQRTESSNRVSENKNCDCYQSSNLTTISMNLLILILVAIIIALTETGIIPPTKVGFYCRDPLFSHEYKGDTVTPVILGVTAILLPIATVLAIEVSIQKSFKTIDIFTVLLILKECLVGAAGVLLLTSIAKTIVGEHRPHFFDTCQPDTGKNCTLGEFVENWECTTGAEYTAYFLVDSTLSFPSGHSSVAWFIATFLSFVILKRLSTKQVGGLMKPFLISVCFTWSLVCSLTRITDRRHHWWDVLLGTVMGILGSLYSIFVVDGKLKKRDSGRRNVDDTIIALS